MLVLFETPAGYGLFKVLDEGKIKKADDIASNFETVEKANKVVKLKEFEKFGDTTDALAAAAALVEGKLCKNLKSFLKKTMKKNDDVLAVADPKLGAAIKEKFGVKCHNDALVNELMRGLRSQMSNLISGSDQDLRTMGLGLSHSLSRFKLKFSPDKVDTMIVQAIGLLDDLDKELNTYAMRVKEWYGWHFPEVAKLIPDNLTFARTIQLMGNRKNCASTDFSDILPEDTEEELKELAKISMGTDVSEDDMDSIRDLCQQVISIGTYRAELYDYLKNRMDAIAPNLTMMVGELVGARLIAHAGSLMNLAKHPASTVQILGAEKALFRALKTKHETPKYGLIYHASLVGQAAPKNKGRISRVLAAKTALSIRVDALGEGEGATVAIENRAKVENRLQQLEGRVSKLSKTPKKTEKYDLNGSAKKGASYNADADAAMDVDETPKKKEKKEKKDKKDKKKKRDSDDEEESPAKVEETPKKDKKEKKDKKDKDSSKKRKGSDVAEEPEKKKKKKKDK